jgi:PadR family transcriptional regulator, regulatory protein PadR
VGMPNVVLLPMRAEELKVHPDAVLQTAMQDGPRHGYAVIKALRQAVGGRPDMATGAVYPALCRLEEAWLIMASWSVVARRRRRNCQLTPAGADALAGGRSGWRDFAAMISAALGAGRCPSPA